MKNWEKYEKEIREIGVDNLAIIDDKPVSCCDRDGARCFECQLDVTNCEDQVYDWLYQDADIVVGDIIKHKDADDVLVYVTQVSGNYFSGFGIAHDSLGETWWNCPMSPYVKTNKHIPLDKVIELIGGTK